MSFRHDAYKAFMSQPGWAKAIEIIGAGVLGYMGVRGIIKWIQKAHDQQMQRQVVKDAGSQLSVLNNQGVYPSYPDSQFSAWASEIRTAFDGCDPSSDDYDTVVRIVKQMNNDADILKLITAFGTPTWDECGWWTGNVTGDLAYGISHEINGISDINAILSSKNITFRF